MSNVTYTDGRVAELDPWARRATIVYPPPLSLQGEFRLTLCLPAYYCLRGNVGLGDFNIVDISRYFGFQILAGKPIRDETRLVCTTTQSDEIQKPRILLAGQSLLRRYVISVIACIANLL